MIASEARVKGAVSEMEEEGILDAAAVAIMSVLDSILPFCWRAGDGETEEVKGKVNFVITEQIWNSDPCNLLFTKYMDAVEKANAERQKKW